MRPLPKGSAPNDRSGRTASTPICSFPTANAPAPAFYCADLPLGLGRSPISERLSPCTHWWALAGASGTTQMTPPPPQIPPVRGGHASRGLCWDASGWTLCDLAWRRPRPDSPPRRSSITARLSISDRIPRPATVLSAACTGGSGRSWPKAGHALMHDVCLPDLPASRELEGGAAVRARACPRRLDSCRSAAPGLK